MCVRLHWILLIIFGSFNWIWILTAYACRHRLHVIFWSSFEVSNWFLAYFWNQQTAYILCRTARDFLVQLRSFQLILSVFWNQSHVVCFGQHDLFWVRFRGFQLILSVFWNQQITYSLCRAACDFVVQFRGFQLVVGVFSYWKCWILRSIYADSLISHQF